jgi:hypothetical protein
MDIAVRRTFIVVPGVNQYMEPVGPISDQDLDLQVHQIITSLRLFLVVNVVWASPTALRNIVAHQMDTVGPRTSTVAGAARLLMVLAPAP